MIRISFIHFQGKMKLTQLEKAGVAVLPGETSDSLEGVKEQVRAYGDTLGDEAKEMAETYCNYFDEKLAWVKERTDKIPEKTDQKFIMPVWTY